MTLDDQFRDATTATITVENVQGTSAGGSGARVFGAPINVLARIEKFIYKAQSHEGKEVVTKGRLFVSPVDTTSNMTLITIRPPDRITIPAGYILGAGPTPRIINVEQLKDEAGSPMYFEVLV